MEVTRPRPFGTFHCLVDIVYVSLTLHGRWSTDPFGAQRHDQIHVVALAQPCSHKINVSQAKTVLHRTRLRFSDRGSFQFYFSTNHIARACHGWRLRGKPEMKTLKRILLFSVKRIGGGSKKNSMCQKIKGQ